MYVTYGRVSLSGAQLGLSGVGAGGWGSRCRTIDDGIGGARVNPASQRFGQWGSGGAFVVASVAARPVSLPATGGTVAVAGRVEHATSCQLQLLSSQSFRVADSHDPERLCERGLCRPRHGRPQHHPGAVGP